MWDWADVQSFQILHASSVLYLLIEDEQSQLCLSSFSSTFLIPSFNEDIKTWIFYRFLSSFSRQLAIALCVLCTTWNTVREIKRSFGQCCPRDYSFHLEKRMYQPFLTVFYAGGLNKACFSTSKSLEFQTMAFKFQVMKSTYSIRVFLFIYNSIG